MLKKVDYDSKTSELLALLDMRFHMTGHVLESYALVVVDACSFAPTQHAGSLGIGDSNEKASRCDAAIAGAIGSSCWSRPRLCRLSWPSTSQLGPMRVPPFLAQKHSHRDGDTPSDALLEDLARHYATTVYHPTSTCRIGEVVDSKLRVRGVNKLRVADASVMPNVISGNTNAACIMIGEKCAELLAREHGVKLAELVGA